MDNKDILAEIFSHITDGSVYKSVYCVSRAFSSVVAAAHPDAHIKFANQLATLMKLYPDAGWSYHDLSYNPNLTLKIVQDNLDKQWYYRGLARNPNVTKDIVRVPLDNWQDGAVPWAIIQSKLYDNETTELDSREEPILDITDWDEVRENLDGQWDWHVLSHCPDLPWDIVRDNPGRDWDWYWLSGNGNIPMDIIMANLDKWDYWELSQDPNITWNIVQDYPERPWNYTGLSYNLSITLADILANPDQPWEADCIDCRSDTSNICDKYYNTLPQHPTWDIVHANPSAWSFSRLSGCTFGKNNR